MVINRKSWHYRLQDSMFEYKGRTRLEPKSLCSYLWTTVAAMLCACFCIIIFSIVTPFSYLVMLPRGYYPRRFSLFVFPSTLFAKDDNCLVCGVKERRALFNIGRRGVYGYQLILAAAGAWALYNFAGDFPPFVSIYREEFTIGVLTLLVTVAMISIGWGIYILISKTRRSETWVLIREYAWAVKHRVCPLIEYQGAAATAEAVSIDESKSML